MTPVPQDVKNEYFHYLAAELQEQKKYRQALRLIEKNIVSPRGKVLLQQAGLLRRFKRFAECIALLKIHLREFPNCPLALEELADAQSMLAEKTGKPADYRRAAKSCQRLLALTYAQRMRGCCTVYADDDRSIRAQTAIYLCCNLMRLNATKQVAEVQRAIRIYDRLMAKGFRITTNETFLPSVREAAIRFIERNLPARPTKKKITRSS